MNFNIITILLFGICCGVIAIIFCFLLASIKPDKSEMKGIEGEKMVRKILSTLPKEYIIINDILVKYRDITTQIDHIVVCRKGVFVIETKNYSGKIYGDDYRKYWIQILKGRQNTFYNPVWQNRTHVNAVKSLLKKKFSYVPVYSVVVFCGNCDIDQVKSDYAVINIEKMNKYIRGYKSQIHITKDTVDNVAHMLINKNIQGEKARKEHVKKIRYLVKDYKR